MTYRYANALKLKSCLCILIKMENIKSSSPREEDMEFGYDIKLKYTPLDFSPNSVICEPKELR